LFDWCKEFEHGSLITKFLVRRSRLAQIFITLYLYIYLLFSVVLSNKKVILYVMNKVLSKQPTNNVFSRVTGRRIFNFVIPKLSFTLIGSIVSILSWLDINQN